MLHKPACKVLKRWNITFSLLSSHARFCFFFLHLSSSSSSFPFCSARSKPLSSPNFCFHNTVLWSHHPLFSPLICLRLAGKFHLHFKLRTHTEAAGKCLQDLRRWSAFSKNNAFTNRTSRCCSSYLIAPFRQFFTSTKMSSGLNFGCHVLH